MTDLAARAATGMARLIAVREQLMPDTCRAVRPADPGQTPALDEDGNVAAPDGPVVYEGPCSLVDPRLPPLRNRTVNDQSASPEQRTLRVPHRADLRTGDLVAITAAGYAPGLVGDVFAVVREDERSHATMRAYVLKGSSWASPPAGP